MLRKINSRKAFRIKTAHMAAITAFFAVLNREEIIERNQTKQHDTSPFVIKKARQAANVAVCQPAADCTQNSQQAPSEYSTYLVSPPEYRVTSVRTSHVNGCNQNRNSQVGSSSADTGSSSYIINFDPYTRCPRYTVERLVSPSSTNRKFMHNNGTSGSGNHHKKVDDHTNPSQYSNHGPMTVSANMGSSILSLFWSTHKNGGNAETYENSGRLTGEGYDEDTEDGEGMHDFSSTTVPGGARVNAVEHGGSTKFKRHKRRPFYIEHNGVPFTPFQVRPQDYKLQCNQGRPSKDGVGQSPDSTSVKELYYDRGHMIPAADFKHDRALLDGTFSMANICPQASKLNKGFWAKFEAWVRVLAESGEHDELLVFTGPLYAPVCVQSSRSRKSSSSLPPPSYLKTYDATTNRSSMITTPGTGDSTANGHGSSSGGGDVSFDINDGCMQWAYLVRTIGAFPRLVQVPTHFFKLVVGITHDADCGTADSAMKRSDINNSNNNSNNSHNAARALKRAPQIAVGLFVVPNTNNVSAKVRSVL